MWIRQVGEHGTDELAQKLLYNYLNTVNSQDVSKFFGLDYTGVVVVLCSHVLYQSIVNLKGGEKYVSVLVIVVSAWSLTVDMV